MDHVRGSGIIVIDFGIDIINKNKEEELIMGTILSILAALVEVAANFGASAASLILGFEPEIPEELQ